MASFYLELRLKLRLKDAVICYSLQNVRVTVATITARKRKKGIVYCAEVRVKGHSRISQTFDRLSEAQRWVEDTEITLRSGGYIGESPPDDMAFTKALDRYELEISSQKRPNTKAREITSANRLRESFKKLSLKEISPVLAAAFRDKRLQSVGPSTIQKDLALSSHSLSIMYPHRPYID